MRKRDSDTVYTDQQLSENMALRRDFVRDMNNKDYRWLFQGKHIRKIENDNFRGYVRVYPYRTLISWARNQRKKHLIGTVANLQMQSFKQHVTEEERAFLRAKVEEIREFYSRENFNNRTREYINNLNLIEW
jgi:hypothetical protein